MSISNEQSFMVRAAWSYYVEGLEQAEVARRLGVSRATVSRLLRRAREEHVVTITVHSSLASCLELERGLRTRARLLGAVVVPTPESPGHLKEALARGAAGYLDQHIDAIRSLAVGWGSTVSLIPPFITRTRSRKLQHVSELFGSLTAGPNVYQPIRLAIALAARFHVDAVALSAPAIVSDAQVRRLLMADEQICGVMAMARSADLILLSIGTADVDSTMLTTGYLGVHDILRLRDQGAVGDVLARYYDVQGRRIESPFEERVVGLTLAELRAANAVMAVAGGPAKIDAIIGAIRGGYITHLVTDERTAQAVVAAFPASRPPREPDAAAPT